MSIRPWPYGSQVERASHKEKRVGWKEKSGTHTHTEMLRNAGRRLNQGLAKRRKGKRSVEGRGLESNIKKRCIGNMPNKERLGSNRECL